MKQAECYILENRIVHNHRYENLRSNLFTLYYFSEKGKLDFLYVVDVWLMMFECLDVRQMDGNFTKGLETNHMAALLMNTKTMYTLECLLRAYIHSVSLCGNEILRDGNIIR